MVKTGINIIRYADDFVLMGRTLTEKSIDNLKTLIDRMGLRLNEAKTRKINAKDESFNFLGFTVRYDRDIYGTANKYWNIIPSKKAEQKIRDKIKDYLKMHGHCTAQEIANGLNMIIRGWVNYFDVRGISYPAVSNRKLRYYLSERIYRYYTRKSQRKCRLYGHNAFETLTTRFGLIDPSKWQVRSARLLAP